MVSKTLDKVLREKYKEQEMGKMTKEYFQQLNWKTASWQTELKLDPKRKSTLTISYRYYDDPPRYGFANCFEQGWQTTANGHRYYGHALFVGSLDEIYKKLSVPLIRMELEKYNDFDIEETNYRIHAKSAAIVNAAKATRNVNELAFADEVMRHIQTLEPTWDSAKIGESCATKHYAGTTAAVMKFNITAKEISRCAGIFCKVNNINVESKILNNEEWPSKLYPTIVLEACISAIIEKHNDNNSF